MYDPFFRKDNFKDERWYEEFCIFLNIGVCRPAPDDMEAVKKALEIMGYETYESNGYLMGVD